MIIEDICLPNVYRKAQHIQDSYNAQHCNIESGALHVMMCEKIRRAYELLRLRKEVSHKSFIATTWRSILCTTALCTSSPFQRIELDLLSDIHQSRQN